MTKERLEELIKQRATIWDNADHFEIKLNPEQYSITEAFGETVLWYQPKDEPSGYDWSWELDVLREDVDHAKWEHDMFESRTERFEPPMWEDIKDNYEFAFVNSEDNEFNLWKFNVFIGKEQDTGIITITDIKGSIFTEHATKKNYEKACEIVRDLFKGEK